MGIITAGDRIAIIAFSAMVEREFNIVRKASGSSSWRLSGRRVRDPRGKIFGAMPMVAKLTPEEARKGLKLLGAKTFFQLIPFLFRRSRSSSGPA